MCGELEWVESEGGCFGIGRGGGGCLCLCGCFGEGVAVAVAVAVAVVVGYGVLFGDCVGTEKLEGGGHVVVVEVDEVDSPAAAAA